MNIYQQELLDHYHHSPHRGTIANPDFSSREHNPSCGDKVSFTGQVQDNVLIALCFEGSGCVISQAAASLLAKKADQSLVTNILDFDAGYMINLVGIPLGPTRLKCALLPLQALQQGLQVYHSKKQG